MLRTLKNLFAVALIGILFSSCISNDDNGKNEVITQQTFGQYIAMITNTTTGESTSLTNIGITLYLNYTTSKANLEITGLKVGANTYPTIKLENITWKSEKSGFLDMEASVLNPNANGILIPQVTNLDGKLVERLIDSLKGSSNPNGYWPTLTVRFTMDGVYSVLLASSLQIFEGNLVSTSESGAKFTTTTPVYTATIDVEKRILGIRMNSVQFVQGMPAMDIDIPAVPFTVSGSDLVINSESIIPSIGDTPFPDYTLTNLKGEIELEDGLELEFVCNPPKLGAFTVEIDAPFDAKTTTGN